MTRKMRKNKEESLQRSGEMKILFFFVHLLSQSLLFFSTWSS
ncbi:hypothetical protein CSUI_004209 [Cystoisospora suis]|uniref:Uncharacterized protein n=1 Tax=Cystoisospora suis TaxID=483139 RepID=A0A2C6L1Y4_9APIC|nr:hypothetical protein CSUI_004209 [Cystoisospora suis]